MSNSERLAEVLGPAFGGPEPRIDERTIDRIADAAESLAGEDFTCAMIASGDVAAEFTGTDGIREAWADWTEAYAELRFRIGEYRDVGENVLMFADQIGTTRHGGVEVEQPSAMVSKFRDGRLYRIEFHLDRRAAERSAAE